MAANMPHMAGMMPQQRPRLIQSQQQQLAQHVYASLLEQAPITHGWQTGVHIQERLGKVTSLISNAILANPSVEFQKAVNFGIEFEKNLFTELPDKATYDKQVGSKTSEMFAKRQQNESSLQNTMNAQHAAIQAQMMQQQQQQQQFLHLNRNAALQAQAQAQMNATAMGQNPQQPFQHLQHPMQASPIPTQPPRQMGAGMANLGAQIPMAMRAPGQEGGAISLMNMSALDKQKVQELATKLLMQTSDAGRRQILVNMQQRLSPQQIQEMQARGVDPLQNYFQNQALLKLHGAAQASRARAGGQGMGLNPSMPQGPMLMQQLQRPMNPAAMGQRPGAANQVSSVNMEKIINEQKVGLMAQETGQQVVPASGQPSHLTTPQPGINMQTQGMAHPQQATNQAQRPPHMQPAFGLQQAQLKLDQQNAQAQAQMRAQAQANKQLQGQPGGLTGPSPTSQSPAMGTLNTPIRQPPVPVSMGQMNAQTGIQNGMPTLDPRFNVQQRPPISMGGNINANSPVAQLLRQMNPEDRQRFSGLPPDKLNELLVKWNESQKQNNMNNANNNLGQLPGRPGQPQPGPFNVGMMMGNVSQQQSGAMPAHMQSAFITQQLAQGRGLNPHVTLVMMDSMDIPPQVRQMLGNLPMEVNKWKDLKAWAQSNPLSAQVYAGLLQLQKTQFRDVVLKKQQAMQQSALQQQQQQPPQQQPPLQQQQQQQQQTPQQQPQPQPQPQTAPQLQQPTQQQQPNPPPATPGLPIGSQPGPASGLIASFNLPPGFSISNIPPNILTPTPAEIQMLRRNPRAANIPDEQIPKLAARIRIEQYIKSLHARGAQSQGGLGMQAQQQPVQGQQPDALPGAPAQAGPGQSQAPNQKPAVSGPGPLPATTTAAETQTSTAPTNMASGPRNNRPTPPNRTGQTQPNASSIQAQAQAQARRNLKRSSPDATPDVQSQPLNASASASAAGQQQVNQRGHSVSGQPLQQTHLPRQEAMNRTAVVSIPSLTKENMERLKKLNIEENQAANREVLPDIPMNLAEKAELTKKLEMVIGKMQKLLKALGRWFAVTDDDARARMFFKTRARLVRQFVDGDKFSQLKPSFSISAGDLDQANAMLDSMINDLTSIYKSMPQPGAQSSSNLSGVLPPSRDGQNQQTRQLQGPAAQQGQTQAQTQAQAQAPVPAPASIPLNSSNLEENAKAHSKMHQKSNSRSAQQPPAAPTSTQPPFSFGATSPHGQQNYIGNPPVTQDSLKIPPSKKKKVNPPSSSSPALPAGAALPQNKPPSPEVKRQAPPEQPMGPPKPVFPCNESSCEMASTGFATEEARDRHMTEEHLKPYEDPFKFFQESLAARMGLDAQGKALTPTSGLPQMQPQPAAPAMSASQSRQGKSKVESSAATPMERTASMNRQGSTTGPGPKSLDPGKGSSTNKSGDASTSAPTVAEESWATTVDPQDLFSSLRFDGGGVISDPTLYRSLTPNDTPESSKDSGASEPNSDISDGAQLDIEMNWAPMDPELLMDMGGISMDGFGDIDSFANLPSWDEVNNDFDKPFVFDTTYYSLDTR